MTQVTGYPSQEVLIKKLLAGDRAALGRAITLVESSAPGHAQAAAALLSRLENHGGQTIRVGITGVPGVGKSTFIESLGGYLIDQGNKVAVLAVDPSSQLTGGSILGDKTRMERLCREPNCFIRPSPAGDTLGGVARSTMETMLVCEAAGFDVILVETVGVGQSEVAVRNLVDCFVLLLLPNAGDALQGIKRGIMELADCLLVNKADGPQVELARLTTGEIAGALHYMRPATRSWTPTVDSISALDEQGIHKAWQQVVSFANTTRASGVFAERRQTQRRAWLKARLERDLLARFFGSNAVKSALPVVESAFLAGEISLLDATNRLLAKVGL